MAARLPPTLRCVALSAGCRLTITTADCKDRPVFPVAYGFTAKGFHLPAHVSQSACVMALLSQGVLIHRKAAPLKVGGDSRKNPVEQLQRTV